jgi:DNA-binding NarL/FixJ family response regulator
MKKAAVSKGANKKKVAVMTHVIEPNAAGIDVGSTEMFVAVPVDRDPQPVRRFTTFTRDLVALADWLKQCGITSVAMESTGVFWIPLFQLLEDRGFRVCLVNARHAKNVPGRKTDVADCQWLQYLHSVGLLRASHRPAQSICAIRSLWRHRESLVQIAAHHTQHMQKALDQMNIQLHHVISDITGVTGLAIIDAILGGERNPKKLAQLRNARIKASEQKVAQALVGDYRSEHLFVLRQSLEAYRQYQRWITDCDREIERQLSRIESKIDPKTAWTERTRLPARACSEKHSYSDSLFITGHGNIPMCVRAMKAGAVEFLTKPFRDQDLLDAIHIGLERDRARREEEEEIAMLQQRFELLTRREREVISMVVSGMLNKQIAGQLGAAENTVKVHRARAMEKMHAQSIADLVRMIEKLKGPFQRAA